MTPRRRNTVLIPALLAVFSSAFLLLVASRHHAAPPAISFTAQSIVLPEPLAAFPATPGGEALTINCTACHSPEMILNQPVLGAEKWQGEIDKMRKVYHAQIPTDQDAALVKALTGLDPQKALP